MHEGLIEMETFGEQVARLRDERKWSQQHLAEVSGVPKRTIQEIEAGRVTDPQRRNRLKLMQALDIEGDAERERAEWPNQVQAILDIVGAYLMTLTPAEQIQWISEFSRGIDR